MGISHLPAGLREAIEAYDRKVSDGEITFDSEGFAVMPAGTPDTEMEFYAAKVTGIVKG